MDRNARAAAVRGMRKPLRFYALLVLVCCLFGAILVAGWPPPARLAVPLVPSAGPTLTRTEATPTDRTPIAATQVAYASAVAAHLAALGTVVALTQAPTAMPGAPTPAASPTPMLGILPGCSNTNAYEPQAISCWRGVVGGQLVDVDAGREGRAGDISQGIVRVHVQDQQGEDIYDTPTRVGAVRIVSVSGSLFTLATIDLPTPQVFVFDLDTRQWRSP